MRSCELPTCQPHKEKKVRSLPFKKKKKNQSLITVVSGGCGRNGGREAEGDSLSGTDLSYSTWRSRFAPDGSTGILVWCLIVLRHTALQAFGHISVLSHKSTAQAVVVSLKKGHQQLRTTKHKEQHPPETTNHQRRASDAQVVCGQRESTGAALTAPRQGYNTHSSSKQPSGFFRRCPWKRYS